MKLKLTIQEMLEIIYLAEHKCLPSIHYLIYDSLEFQLKCHLANCNNWAHISMASDLSREILPALIGFYDELKADSK